VEGFRRQVDNLGTDMAIDEKQIGGDFYTILTNRNSGKIALLAQTIKANELSQLIPKFGLRGFYVKSITRDLSPAMIGLAVNSFAMPFTRRINFI